MTWTTTPASIEPLEIHRVDRQPARAEAPPPPVRPLHIQPESSDVQGAHTPAATSLVSVSGSRTLGEVDTAMRIMAKSIVRELGKHGYGCRETIVLSTELVRLASAELEHRRNARHVAL